MPERFATKVDDAAPLDKVCGFACGVSTGMGAAMIRANVTPGSSVMVVGAGGVGCSAMLGAKVKGATQIIAIDIAANKIARAKERGWATHVIDATDNDVLAAVRDLTGGRGVDYAFDAVGTSATAEVAIAGTRQGGTCVIIGRADATVLASIDTSQFLRHKWVTGTFGGSIIPKVHIPQFVDLYQQGRLDLDGLLDAALLVRPDRHCARRSPPRPHDPRRRRDVIIHPSMTPGRWVSVYRPLKTSVIRNGRSF